ncbi:unnamed protein product, partial [Callosobruchus maculatus]
RQQRRQRPVYESAFKGCFQSLHWRKDYQENVCNLTYSTQSWMDIKKLEVIGQDVLCSLAIEL